MDAVHSSNSDFNYHDYLGECCYASVISSGRNLFSFDCAEEDLKLFGVDSKERERRRQVYIKEEKEQGRKAPPPQVEKTKPKKLDDVEQAHQGLANLFAKRS